MIRSPVPLVLLLVFAPSCIADDEVPLDDDVSVEAQPLLPGGGTVHIAVVPYRFTDSVPAEMTPLTGGTQWNLQGLAFTGAGTDDATGSVKGFYSAISGGRIDVRGTIYPWIPVLTMTATRFDQRALWRPIDDWYIPPTHQVAGFDCGRETWGGTPGRPNVTTILRGNPAHPNLYLCRDPEGDANHFWSLDGNGPYTAASVCPLGGNAQLPQAGAFYCIHRNIQMHSNIRHSWALYAATGGNVLPPGIDDTGAAVTAPYNPADWESDNRISLYGFPTSNTGFTVGAHSAYVALGINSRSYALYLGIHESGHILGLQHASSLMCATGGFGPEPTNDRPPLGTVVPFAHGNGTCLAQDKHGYGPHNFMGGHSRNFGDAYALLAIGAMPPGNLSTVTTSGTYALPALASSPRALRIASGKSLSGLPPFDSLPGQAYYYLGHRAPVPNTFDSTVSPSFTGVEVRVAPDHVAEQARCGTSPSCTRSLLLDMHPETAGDFADAPLKTGESFTDRTARITMQATLGTSPIVDVTFTPSTTKLLVTPSSGGTGQVLQQTTGSLQALQTINGFSTWPLISGANTGGVCFYNSGSIYTAYVDDTGRYRSSGAVTGTAANVAGWTHISPVGRAGLIFYNANTGAYVTATLGATGAFAVKSSGIWAAGWTAITGLLNGAVVWYRATDGVLSTGSMDANGVTSNVRAQPNVATGFTKLTAVREDGLLLYDGTSGVARTAQVDDARNFTLKASEVWNTGYTSIPGGSNGNLLLYRASDGFTFLVNVEASFNTVWIGSTTSPGTNLVVTSTGGDIQPLPPAPVPAAPTLDVDFTGCPLGAPRFLIDWTPASTAPITSYDVDIRRGSNAWQDLYDGMNRSVSYTGSANRTDVVRVRACNVSGCSAFTQRTYSFGCVLPS